MKKCVMRMALAAVAAAMIVGLAGCGPAKADTDAMDAALTAAARLRSKVEAGVVYADYSNAVGDTKGTIDLFTESPSAVKAYPAVAKDLESAMRAYVGAAAIWNAKIQDTQNQTPFVSAVAAWPALVTEFTGLSDQITSVPVWDGSTSTPMPAISADGAMQALWTVAGARVDWAKTAAAK